MMCEDVQNYLGEYLDPAEDAIPRAAIAEHLAGCAECTEHLRELSIVTAMLRDRKAPDAPPDLMDKIRLRLADEPVPAPASPPSVLARVSKLINWPSLAAGAVAAGTIIALVTVVLRNQAPLPTIQTAAVTVASPTSVNIGFDVAQDVNDVTFTIDLPKGLEFVDANNQPIDSQSVSWQGELKRGKTVVPIMVRGVQPGRFEILATVRKNQFAQTTKIVVPIEGRQGTNPSAALSASLILEEGKPNA
ncbi:zf-HC2 domain-containing protein [bacterium]|nr:zf-HC2 domain-containing protein [bacterium]